SEGFNTTVLPPAIAGPILCAVKFNGILNGVIAPITPTGVFIVKDILLFSGVWPSIGTPFPAILFASSDEIINVFIALVTSVLQSLIVRPTSLDKRFARSSLFLDIKSAVILRISLLLEGESSIFLKVSLASLTALLTVDLFEAITSPISFFEYLS